MLLLVGPLMRISIMLTDLGRVYHAPFDVEPEPNTVIHPDVLVVLKDTPLSRRIGSWRRRTL